MTATTCLLFAAAALGPSVEVVTLNGEKHAGELKRLTAETLTLGKTGGSVSIPVAELMNVVFPKFIKPKTAPAAVIVVTLRDKTRLLCKQVTTTARRAKLESAAFGTFSVPLTNVAHIRFAGPDPKLDEKWKVLCARTIKKDYLVIPKTNVLDHIDGIVGAITKERIGFTLAGNAVDPPRTSIFGVIYARGSVSPPAAKPLCRVDAAGSDTLLLSSLRYDGTKLSGRLLAGSEVEIPLSSLKAIDFSLGKVKYLSAMEPREVKYTSYFDDKLDVALFRYRRDRTYDAGKPIQLAGKKYARGLWIHSRTFLRYRLGRDFRRFKAVMGIDDNAQGNGDVHVVISGDGKILLETDVRKGDKPRTLDIDVSNVRDLEILVDYGRFGDSGDHLDLAEARVIK